MGRDSSCLRRRVSKWLERGSGSALSLVAGCFCGPSVLVILTIGASGAARAAMAEPMAIADAVIPSNPQELRSLPALSIKKSNVTVSGLSAGAFMAVQLHVIFSNLIHGVGVIAGGIYYCSEGQISTAFSQCMYVPDMIKVDRKVAFAKAQADEGKIAPTTNLANSRIYIYSSSEDRVINSGGAPKIAEFYKAFGPQNHLISVLDFKSAHGFPTVSEGIGCLEQGVPWINACNRNIAQEMLSQVLGSPAKTKAFDPERLYLFSQEAYYENGAFLYPKGYIYIPKACVGRRSKCALHIALHGCQQNIDDVQDQFETKTGLLEVAEAESIVMLFPQVGRDDSKNPYACWDWFGYTGADFANKSGPQIKALRKMISNLSGF